MVEEEELRNFINSEVIQSIMDNFYSLTQIGVGIIDLKGNVLVATGWQDICTCFHRLHSETAVKCKESDIVLSQGVPPGEIKGYQCKNNLWEFVTPIYIADKHMGNLFLGQFFFEDEVPDYDLFDQQADRYGFDKTEYRAALDRVPRWSRERVNTVLRFYRLLTDMISGLSYSNQKLAIELNKNKQSKEALQKAKDELEQRVADRTTELLHVNEELQTDITERKRAEEALQESERHYRTLFDQANEGLLMMTLDGQLFECNQSFAEMHGYTVDELKHKDIRELDALKDRALADRAEIIRRIQAGEVVRFEVEHYHKDGHIFPLSVTTSMIRIGGQMYYLAFHQDVTERKQAEELLRNREEIFSLFMKHSPFYTYIKQVTSTENRVLQASDNFQQMIGIHGSKMIGKTMPELFPAEMAAKIIADDWRVVANGEVLEFEEDFNGRNYFTTKFPVVQGDKTFLAGYSIDITERKQSEAAKKILEAQNQQLQKAESLGRMAGAIAHTFNNQLAVVIGNLEMAIQDLPQDAEPVKSLNEAMQAANKAAEVSGQMLTYLGQSFDKRVLLDLAEACRRNLPILEATMPKRVALETAFPSPGPAIMANAIEIQQVLANLITNAWEAVGTGRGSIHLSVKTVYAADILPSHRFPVGWQSQDSAYACLEVTDTGDGIADKDIEKLFDPFFTSKFTGRGLGLAMLLGIVKAHGGAVTVESEPGRGSTFRVFLPVSAEEVPRQPDKASQPLAIEEGGTILLVEDEEMVRNMAAAMLKRLGFSVLEAKDGGEAVEQFREHHDKIRCVLSDLTMPSMNGWETLTALRKLAPDIPVILASGYDKAQVMAGEHSEMPQVFLGKPYKLKELGDAISQALVNNRGKDS